MFVAAVALAIGAYALFFAYDVFNVRAPQVRIANALFPLAFIMVALSTVIMVWISKDSFSLSFGSVLCLALSLACGIAMIVALFFSLPKDTYAEPGVKRKAYRGGMYALCRHPGVLWYALTYVFLMMSMQNEAGWIICMVLIAGNVLYMLLQDFWTFPAIFVDYADYKCGTPLFFPTPSSVAAWLGGKN